MTEQAVSKGIYKWSFKIETMYNPSIPLDIIDGIYHFIFHTYESGLRVIDTGDDIVIDDTKQEMDDYYDPEYARMSARISKTKNNTQRFDRINTSNKFNVNIGGDDNDATNLIKSKSDGITYLDSIYKRLSRAGVDEKVIEDLSNYVKTELFDTEALEIDLEIGKGGNIENTINDKTCIDCIITFFETLVTYFHCRMIYEVKNW